MNQSVLLSNPECVSNLDYNKLIQLRTIGSNPNNPIPPVTTLNGRLTGQNVIFTDTETYEDYKMRRKVGVLEYNTTTNIHGHIKTKKQNFSRMSQIKGSSQFSQVQLKNLATTPCDYIPVLLPPTNSGVRDLTFPGYKLNKSIQFKLSL